jgi:MarR family transcriptional regulator for hemolysin
MAANPTISTNQSSKRETWRRLSQSQTWAANASVPLMFRLGRTNRVVAQQLEEFIALSLPQMRILFEALEPEGVSQATLTKQYQIDPASITRTVQAMERDGLITRRPDENDNRLMRVYITEKGRLLTESLPPQLVIFEQQVVKGLTENEILLLHSLLEKIEGQMNPESTEEPNKNS